MPTTNSTGKARKDAKASFPMPEVLGVLNFLLDLLNGAGRVHLARHRTMVVRVSSGRLLADSRESLAPVSVETHLKWENLDRQPTINWPSPRAWNWMRIRRPSL